MDFHRFGTTLTTFALAALVLSVVWFKSGIDGSLAAEVIFAAEGKTFNDLLVKGAMERTMLNRPNSAYMTSHDYEAAKIVAARGERIADGKTAMMVSGVLLMLGACLVISTRSAAVIARKP